MKKVLPRTIRNADTSHVFETVKREAGALQHRGAGERNRRAGAIRALLDTAAFCACNSKGSRRRELLETKLES